MRGAQLCARLVEDVVVLVGVPLQHDRAGYNFRCGGGRDSR